MQIVQNPTASGIVPSNNAATATNAHAVDGTALGLNGENAATQTPVNPSPTSAAPLRRGLSNWDSPLQNEISSAQQALDFLEQSAAQLRGLKADLSAKLASRQIRDGSVEARVRQFSNTWRNRQQASGGSLDPRLSFNRKGAQQRFAVRGMSLANLRTGAKETLAISVGGSSGVRSVTLEAGLSDSEIAQRFDDALAPAGVRVSVGDNGQLEFSTPESNFASVRDAFAVQGACIRYPSGQLNRVKVEPESSTIDPDSWQTGDMEGLRSTLQQVLAALAQVEQAISSVHTQLNQASARAAEAAPAGATTAGMTQVANRFVTTTAQPGYQSLLSINSALAGISRDRVISLLQLR